MSRFLLGLLFLAGLTASAAGADEKTLSGTWNVVQMEYDGRAVDAKVAAKFSVVFASEKVTFKGRLVGNGGQFDFSDGDDTYSFTLNTSKKPTQLDIKDGCRTMRGIIEVDGDTLKLGLSFAGERPTQFTSRDQAGVGYMVLKRAKK